VLWAIGTADGSRRAEMKLDFLPAFDGMIAADGRLIISTAGGEVVCFAAR
jgi:hypothetical protein